VKMLVAYASKGGASGSYAGRIAAKLAESGIEADLVDLRSTDVGDLGPYGCIVVGAGVRIGMVYGKARRFLRRRDLAGKRLALFLASGMAVEDPVKAGEKYLLPLVAKYGLSPVKTGSFPGVTPGQGGRRTEEEVRKTVDPWVEDLGALLGSPD